MSQITHLLVDTCNLQRKVPVSLGGGRFREDYTTFATPAVRISSSRGGSERTPAEQQVTYAYFVGYFEPDQDVKRDDKLIVLSGTHEGRMFRVMGTTDPSLVHHRRVTLEEIQRG